MYTISILIIIKGNNLVKLYMELQFLFSGYRLIMVHIYIMFGKIIMQFQIYGAKMLFIFFITKGHNSLNIINGVKVLFSAHPLIMVKYPVSRKIS